MIILFEVELGPDDNYLKDTVPEGGSRLGGVNMANRINRAYEMIAESILSGYSALFTYAVKETLTAEERERVASQIRQLADTSTASEYTFSVPLRP